MPNDFIQVDVFTTRPLCGNPAAVVFDADELSAETMQRVAREMNLSETVFLVRPTTPDADYRARIFTPRRELPFAGHPTIAAAHAVLSRQPEKTDTKLLRQECGMGIVPVDVLHDGGERVLRMTQGAPVLRDTDLSREMMAWMLGCTEGDLAATPFAVVSTGVPWLIVQLSRLAAISALAPDHGLIARECAARGAVGVTVFVERGDDGPIRLRVRTFSPGEGIDEDPVCGSGNGCVAAFLAHHQHCADDTGEYLAEQGIEIGRDGVVHASWRRQGDELRVMVGGAAVTVASGQLHL